LPLGAPGGRRHRSTRRAELGRAGAERQDIGGGRVHAALQAAPQSCAVVVVLERDFPRVDVLRQAAFDLQQRQRVFVRRDRVALVEPELVRERADESAGVIGVRPDGLRDFARRGGLRHFARPYRLRDFARNEIAVPPKRPAV